MEKISDELLIVGSKERGVYMQAYGIIASKNGTVRIQARGRNISKAVDVGLWGESFSGHKIIETNCSRVFLPDRKDINALYPVSQIEIILKHEDKNFLRRIAKLKNPVAMILIIIGILGLLQVDSFLVGVVSFAYSIAKFVDVVS